MGGYGGALGKIKGNCYYDTGGHKVTDKNAIEVAEYYIAQGKYVAFLQQNQTGHRADLSVEGQPTEVKGISSIVPNNFAGKIAHAFVQIHGDDYKYNVSERTEGKIILLSKHSKSIPDSTIYNAFYEAYKIAYRKGSLNGTGKIEFWIRGKIYQIN